MLLRALFGLATRGLLGIALLGGGCSRTDVDGSRTDDFSTREQAQFDRERKPEKIVEALGIGPGDRVADIGASSGLMTVHLARAVAPTGRVVATDIDSAVLRLLAQHLRAAGLTNVVEPRVVAADAPGLEEKTYDAILLAEVDHLLADPVAWLGSARRALKPGGRIVISNRVYRHAKSLAAAQKAGMILTAESNPVPTHFIAIFIEPRGS